jgi:signal transduction histidine kinase
MPVSQEPGAQPQYSRDESDRRDRELSEFLLRLTHDLRSPMRAIRAHAELIARDATTPEGGPDPRAGFIVSGAQALELLANGLSTYALALRIDESSFQSAQMDVLLRFVLAKIRKELQEARAEVVYDELPRVLGNPDQLSQLFEMLLLNAVRHRGTEAPRIQVSATGQGADWLFSVRDNGPGIEAAHLERIFKPFERLRGKESPGPGLGLAIAREIVRKHGGRIWAESEPGKGVNVLFTLPAR